MFFWNSSGIQQQRIPSFLITFRSFAMSHPGGRGLTPCGDGIKTAQVQGWFDQKIRLEKNPVATTDATTVGLWKRANRCDDGRRRHLIAINYRVSYREIINHSAIHFDGDVFIRNRIPGEFSMRSSDLRELLDNFELSIDFALNCVSRVSLRSTWPNWEPRIEILPQFRFFGDRYAIYSLTIFVCYFES